MWPSAKNWRTKGCSRSNDHPDELWERDVMAPTAIRDGADATNAFSEMARNLRQGARQLRKPLGWKGGADEFTVYWRAEEGFWSVLEDGFAENRYWCCFGTGDPDAVTKLSITCEINPPF